MSNEPRIDSSARARAGTRSTPGRSPPASGTPAQPLVVPRRQGDVVPPRGVVVRHGHLEAGQEALDVGAARHADVRHVQPGIGTGAASSPDAAGQDRRRDAPCRGRRAGARDRRRPRPHEQSQRAGRPAPLVAGTKVRFDFRGHGRSSAPPTGYAFVDFARDLDAVASAYGATRGRHIARCGRDREPALPRPQPVRAHRLADARRPRSPFPFRSGTTRWRRSSRKTAEEALEEILSAPERVAEYLQVPWKRELDRLLWDHDHPDGVARRSEASSATGRSPIARCSARSPAPCS